MNISANTIIQKMKSETEKLSKANHDSESVYDAIQRIHLLSELWLESYQGEKVQEAHLAKQEAMPGKMQPSELQESDAKNVRVIKEDTSIFDF